MVRRRRAEAVVALLCAFACSCASARRAPDGAAAPEGDRSEALDDAGATGPSAQLDEIDDFCVAMAEARCAVELACCRQRGFTADAQLCAAYAYWEDGRCGQGRLASTNSYDPAAARRCVELHASSFVDCHPRRADDARALAAAAACAKVSPPRTLGPGDVCDGCTTCCAAPDGQVSQCRSGTEGLRSYCSESVPAGRAGENCGMGCDESLVCNPDSWCSAPLADAAPCALARQCASGYCEPTAGVCAAQPPAVSDSRCGLLDELARFGLYAEPTNGVDLFVTDRELLWPRNVAIVEDDLRRAPKDGSGSITGLDVQGSSFSGLAVATNDALYSVSNNQVLRTSLADGSQTTFAKPGFAIGALSRHADELVAAGSRCNVIARIALGDGGVQYHPERLTLDMQDATSGVAIAIDGDDVYCAVGRYLTRYAGDTTASVVSEALLPAALVEPSVRDLVLLGERLFVRVEHGASARPRPRALVAYDLASGSAAELAVPSELGTSLVADVSRAQLYYRTQGGIQVFDASDDSFHLLELPYSGDTTTGLSADATHLYWTTTRGIFRREKP